jgi:hypothetical protein
MQIEVYLVRLLVTAHGRTLLATAANSGALSKLAIARCSGVLSGDYEEDAAAAFQALDDG